MGGGGSSEPRTPLSAPLDLSSRHTAWLLLAIGEGEIESIESVYLDNKPIQNFSHAVAITYGTALQEPISGFSDTPTTNSSNIQLFQKTGLAPVFVADTLLAVNPNADYAEVEFTLQNLETINATNGDRLQNSIAIQLASSISDTVTTYPNPQPSDGCIAATGKAGRTTTPYAWTVRIDAPKPKPLNWYIHIRRTSADTDSDNRADCFITNLTSFEIDSGSAYPFTSLVAVRVEDASQLGNQIPIVSAAVKGMKLIVPDNYNPLTRTRTGNWTGGFATFAGQPFFQYTNNLSWVIYNLLTDWHLITIDGVPMQKFIGIDRAFVDKWSFENFAKHCDEPITNSAVVGTVRHTVNGQFIERRKSTDFIDTLLSLGNARLVESNGLIKVVYDKQLTQLEIDVLPLVTPDMIESGLFEFTGSDISERTTQINVIYSDKTEYNHTKTAIATSYELEAYLSLPQGHFVSKYDLSVTDFTLEGCDNFEQATRKARWLLWNSLQTTEMVSFKTVLPVLNAADYFILADSDGLTGRIEQVNVGVSKTQIIIDTVPPLTPTSITCFNELGDPATYQVVSQTGKELIVINSGLRPAKASAYSLNTLPNIWQVTGISKDESSLIWVYSAVKYQPEKYNFIDGAVNESVHNHYKNTSLPPITNVWYNVAQGRIEWQGGLAGAFFNMSINFDNAQHVFVDTQSTYHVTTRPLWVTINQRIGIRYSEYRTFAIA